MTALAQPIKIRSNKVFTILEQSTKRITSLRGGTRSGKTYNVLIWFVMRYLRETGKVLTIARQTMPALKASAMRDFFEILDTLGLYDERNHNKTNNEYHLNGNLIEFIGLSESARIRGRKRDDAFINEINETTYDAFRQLLFRTTRKVVCDYNPSDPYSWVYDSLEVRDDCELEVTTYKDNPFLEDTLVREIELLKETDPDYWNIYGLGQIGEGGLRVWSHWRELAGNIWPYDKGQTVFGLDFGYRVPTALVEVTFYDDTLYWREILYRADLTNADLIRVLKTIPELRGRTIVADSAEPQRIEEIRRAGFKIQPAFKVHKNTIDFVKSKPLFIHSESTNILKEIKKYSNKVDKDGNIVDGEVVKFDDHACFIAGTLVTTIDGEKPIERITTEDSVLTREGYKSVIVAGETSDDAEVMTLTFDNGKSITGTPNHPVFIKGLGFIRMDEVRYNDLCKSSSLNQTRTRSASALWALFSDAIRTAATRQIESISNATRDICTVLSGNSITENLFRPITTFITSISTLAITPSVIWSASPALNISQITPAKPISGHAATRAKNTWIGFDRSRKLGISRTPAENGTANTESEWPPTASPLQKSVRIAERNMKRSVSLQKSDSAPRDARRRPAEQAELMTLFKRALNALRRSRQTSTQNKDSVPRNAFPAVRVVKVGRQSKPEPVFNLTVAECPEFFANGILVHNCDAGRYASFYFNQTKPKFRSY